MAKTKTAYLCDACGYSSGKWHGRCPECGSWEEMREFRPSAEPEAGRLSASATVPQPFPEIRSRSQDLAATGLSELDRVLGGGLVPGAAVLLAGEPGIGKSTLMLQAASAFASAGGEVLYISGEESADQLHRRGLRLGVSSDRLLVLAETEIPAVLEAADRSPPGWLMVDSIQAVSCPDVAGVPGTVTQVRESASRLVRWAKRNSVPLVLVGHVTKDGSIAGPRVLEHLVDTVLQFEGDRHHAHRLLRTLKNRFGPSDEMAVFGMAEAGLHQIENPSELFLSERPVGSPGSSVLAAVEGSRPLMIEIQALVGEPIQGSPRRTTLGFDGGRLAMILAVLQRRAGVDVVQRDVFVNVTGGVRLAEPAADLAVAAAVVSSATGRALPERTAFCGELGLTGEIRGVARVELRVREAERLGFDTLVAPPLPESISAPPGLRIRSATDLSQAIEFGFL